MISPITSLWPLPSLHKRAIPDVSELYRLPHLCGLCDLCGSFLSKHNFCSTAVLIQLFEYPDKGNQGLELFEESFLIWDSSSATRASSCFTRARSSAFSLTNSSYVGFMEWDHAKHSNSESTKFRYPWPITDFNSYPNGWNRVSIVPIVAQMGRISLIIAFI